MPSQSQAGICPAKGGVGERHGIDPRLGDVAIKTLAQQFDWRSEREARADAALNHPNICQIYDIGPNHLVMDGTWSKDRLFRTKLSGDRRRSKKHWVLRNRLPMRSKRCVCHYAWATLPCVFLRAVA